MPWRVDNGSGSCHGSLSSRDDGEVGGGEGGGGVSSLTLRRFSEDSVTGMIQDLFMLAKADFTVCSYTSNVGLLLRK